MTSTPDITQILTAFKWDSMTWNNSQNLTELYILIDEFRQLIFVLYHDIICVCFRQQDGKNYPMAQIIEITI